MDLQTLYYGGPILTMEGGYAQALLLKGTRIEFVGPLARARLLLGRESREVDLKGRALMPAFVDSHSHFAGVAMAKLQVPLEDCASFEEIEDRLARFIRDSRPPQGAWVVGKGYDHNHLREKAHPDRLVLDRACPGHPAVIQHASGHVGVFSTLALERLGVDRDAADPAGGRMARSGEGELTGYMEENAFIPLIKQVPLGDMDQLLRAFEQAQRDYAAHGVATVQEGMMARELIGVYQALLGSGKLKLDVAAYADPNALAEVRGAFPQNLAGYQGHFRIGGEKIFLDGSPQGRTAWMRRPYLGEAEYRGYPVLTDEQLDQRLEGALERGAQLLAHCNGDAAAQQYLDALARLERKTGKRLVRPVMIHAQLLGRDQLPQLKRLGVIPSFFAAHVYHWGDIHVKNFGPERAAGLSPAGSALECGIPFTLHQDSPVIPPDMLETVWCAAVRRTSSGRLLGPEERLPVHQALRAVTINAAYQYFEEREKGSLKAGKRADLVILSADPLKMPPMKLRDIQVLETIKDGAALYTNETEK